MGSKTTPEGATLYVFLVNGAQKEVREGALKQYPAVTRPCARSETENRGEPALDVEFIRPSRPGPRGMAFNLAMENEIMSKAQDSKKEAKKEPAKTMKEKKEAKKVKKEERKR